MDTKPGYLTTEFWVTLLTNIISAVVAVLSLTGHHLTTDTLTPLVPLGSMIAASFSTTFYAHGRTTLKVAAATPPVPTIQVTSGGNS